MRKSTWKKAVSLLLASTMVVGSAAAISGCGGKKKGNETITLDVYSQVANYSGIQTGWFDDVIKEKFNVKLNIIQDGNGVLQTRMEDGDLGDIVIWEKMTEIIRMPFKIICYMTGRKMIS